jgi:hypothetical protein
MEETRASYTISCGHGEKCWLANFRIFWEREPLHTASTLLQQPLFLVLFGRGTGGQFAEKSEQRGCGFLIGKVF